MGGTGAFPEGLAVGFCLVHTSWEASKVFNIIHSGRTHSLLGCEFRTHIQGKCMENTVTELGSVG